MKDPHQLPVNWAGFTIAAANTLLLSYLCWGVMNKQFSPEAKDILNVILGVLLAKHSDLFQWAFGTSSQAKRAQDVIASQADTIKSQVPPAAAPTIPVGPGESVTVEARPSNDA